MEDTTDVLLETAAGTTNLGDGRILFSVTGRNPRRPKRDHIVRRRGREQRVEPVRERCVDASSRRGHHPPTRRRNGCYSGPTCRCHGVIGKSLIGLCPRISGDRLTTRFLGANASRNDGYVSTLGVPGPGWW